MLLKPIADIIITRERQRQEFEEGPLNELAASIRTKGLLHAVVVRDDGVTLVAGERRLRAIQKYIWPLGMNFYHAGVLVPQGFLPVVPLAELSEHDLEEAELDENLKRRDLTWQELAAAQSRLHNLRQRQAALAGGVHTVTDTARELSGKGADVPASDMWAREPIRQNILLAAHLDDPAVAKAKSAKEAFKLLINKEEQERHRALALSVGQTFTAAVHEAHHTNCLAWMAACAPGQFNVILTDPPYGVDADQFGDGAGKLTGIEHDYDDSYAAWQELMRKWCPLSFRVTKPEAHAYVFCDFDRFHELKGWMQAAGWYVFRTPFVVYKTDSGRVPLPDLGPRRQYEIVLYAIKGKKPTTGLFSDVIPCQADEQMGHGAQKPIALFTNLLKRSVRPGDRVLDAFSGSGTIFPAAHGLQVAAVGLEKKAASYGKGLERLGALATEVVV